MDLVETPRSGPARSEAGQPPAIVRAGNWQAFAPPGHEFVSALHQKLIASGGSGVLLCLPENPTEEHVGLLLRAARAVTAVEGTRGFVLVQHGWGGAGFARTLHLETPGLTTCVVIVPKACPAAVVWIAAEAALATGYTEAHYKTGLAGVENRD